MTQRIGHYHIGGGGGGVQIQINVFEFPIFSASWYFSNKYFPNQTFFLFPGELSFMYLHDH